jgi:hypothetical protein
MNWFFSKVNVTSLLIVSMCLATACDKDSDAEADLAGTSIAETAEADKPEVKLPQTRDLDPYTIDASKPVIAENLHDEVMAWTEAWKGKEVSVIVWTKGGLSTKSPMLFDTKESPGKTAFGAKMSDEERRRLGELSANAEFAVIKGKIDPPSFGHRLTIEDAVAVEPYEKQELPEGQKLDPAELDADTPVNPLDLERSIEAWKGVKVQIKDEARIPMSGNIVSFPKEEEAGKERQYFVKAQMGERISPDLPSKAVKTLSCEVEGLKQGSFDPAPHLKIGMCSFVE